MSKAIQEKIRQNWKAGLTVSFVSIPLSISLAVAAGATPLMGVITAIWAGLIASFLGGSNFNIFGPTGALSGILVVYAIKYGVGILPLLAILSGIVIIAIYLLRWERYIVFVPSSVIHGFTLGVAFIIALGQFNFAFGLKNLPSHESLLENLKESFMHLNLMDWGTFSLFAIGLIFLFAWKKIFTKIPGVIVLAPVGILLGFLSQKSWIGLELQTLFSKFGNIAENFWSLPTISFNLSQDLVIGALVVALVAILETLLSAKIADGMTKTKHNTRKEVLAVGAANITSGVFGGIPATAALARTALNIKSGANDKMSATINSIFVFLISALLLFVFKYLPLAVVASILVFTAAQMVEKKHLVRIYRNDKSALFTALLVALVTIVEDPMAGILLGSAVALLIFANKMSRAEIEINLNDKDKHLIKRVNAAQLVKVKDECDILVYRFAGQLTYVNINSHLNTIEKINGETKAVILSLRNLFFVDMDGVEAIGEMIETLQRKNKQVFLSAANGLIYDSLKKEEWFLKMKRRKLVFASTQEALTKCSV